METFRYSGIFTSYPTDSRFDSRTGLVVSSSGVAALDLLSGVFDRSDSLDGGVVVVVVGSVSEGGLLPRISLLRGDRTGDGGGVGSSSVSGVS